MKIIFSNINYETALSNSWPQLASLSNYLIQLHGYETIFFGDEFSLKFYKNIKYTHFELLNKNEIEQFPKCLWSIGKLLALSKIKEPVIHIDLDVLLNQNFNFMELNKDIICLHDEFCTNKNIEKLQDLFENKRPDIITGYGKSYNCGLVGGNDYLSLHKAIDIAFKCVVDNFNFIELIYNKYKDVKIYKRIFFPPVLIEQIWIFQILERVFNKKINTIINTQESWKNINLSLLDKGIVHLMISKSKPEIIKYINEQVNTLQIKY